MKNKILHWIFVFLRAIIIALLIVLPLMKAIEWQEDKRIKKIKLNIAYTKGEVTRIYFSKIQCVVVRYYVKNKAFEATSGVGFGDKLYIQYYKVMYDSTKPEDAEILTEEPLFKEMVDLDSTMATIIQINSNDFIRYEYQLGSKKFQKFQKFFDISNYKIGQSVICYYVKEAPETTIIDYPNFKTNQKYLK